MCSLGGKKLQAKQGGEVDGAEEGCDGVHPAHDGEGKG